MQDARLAFRMVRLPGALSMLSRSRPSTTAGLCDLTDATSNAGGCARVDADSASAARSKQTGIEGGLMAARDCSRRGGISVLRGMFHMVEDDDLRRALLRFQLDPELVLQRFEKSRSRG